MNNADFRTLHTWVRGGTSGLGLCFIKAALLLFEGRCKEMGQSRSFLSCWSFLPATKSRWTTGTPEIYVAHRFFLLSS